MSLDVWDGLMIGIYIGVGIGWLWHRKPPIIKDAKIEAKLIVSQEMIDKMNDQLTQQYVNGWLEKRGLVWMPKGAVFELNKDAKK
jgi:hypothetical protein